MRMRRKLASDVRGRPQRELSDHPDIGVGAECLHHIVWQAGAGRQLLPRLHQRIGSEKSRPLRPAGTFFEEGECDTWLGYRIDVVGREPPFVGESYGGSLEA